MEGSSYYVIQTMAQIHCISNREFAVAAVVSSVMNLQIHRRIIRPAINFTKRKILPYLGLYLFLYHISDSAVFHVFSKFYLLDFDVPPVPGGGVA